MPVICIAKGVWKSKLKVVFRIHLKALLEYGSMGKAGVNVEELQNG